MKNAYFPYNLNLPLPNVGIGIKSYRKKWFNDSAIKSDSMHAFSIKSNWEWQFYRSKLISRMETNWHRTTNVQDVWFCVGLTELVAVALRFLSTFSPFNNITTTHIPIYNYFTIRYFIELFRVQFFPRVLWLSHVNLFARSSHLIYIFIYCYYFLFHPIKHCV